MPPRALRLLACLALTAPGAFAQPRPGPVPGAVPFEEAPARVESVGLTFLIPVGATAQHTRIGPKASTRVTPKEEAKWVIDVQTIRESPSTTTTDVLGKISQSLLESAGIRDSSDRQINATLAEVLAEETNLVLPGGAAERVYIAIPQASDQPRLVRGYTVFANAPGTFVSFALTAYENEFAEARRLYEAVVATAAFEDPGQVAAAREAAVRTGAALLARLSEEDYRAALRGVSGQWQRLYRPAPTGSDADAEELGYRRITAWLGRREDVERSDRGTPRDADTPEGYVVRTEARLLSDGATIDTMGTFFLSFDRADEAWLIRLARREGPTRQQYTETGARHEGSMVVTVQGDQRVPEVYKPVIEGEGYLSQAQVYLLPQLLVRAGIEADYAFYCYQSSLNSIRLRRDSLERSGQGLWSLATRTSEEATRSTSLYDADGALVRADLGDGRLWEPVSLERLAALWKRKGLPMD